MGLRIKVLLDRLTHHHNPFHNDNYYPGRIRTSEYTIFLFCLLPDGGKIIFEPQLVTRERVM